MEMQKQVKAIWSDWKNVPETMDDGKLTPIRWFKKYLNENYTCLSLSSINGNYITSSIDANYITCTLKGMGVSIIKPNGIYNIPCFPTEERQNIIDYLNSKGWYKLQLR
jgi:hypothetical protein